MKTFKQLVESTKVDKLSKLIDNSIVSIDDSLSVDVFAQAVAKVLADEYGSHNYKSFISTLQKELR